MFGLLRQILIYDCPKQHDRFFSFLFIIYRLIIITHELFFLLDYQLSYREGFFISNDEQHMMSAVEIQWKINNPFASFACWWTEVGDRHVLYYDSRWNNLEQKLTDNCMQLKQRYLEKFVGNLWRNKIVIINETVHFSYTLNYLLFKAWTFVSKFYIVTRDRWRIFITYHITLDLTKLHYPFGSYGFSVILKSLHSHKQGFLVKLWYSSGHNQCYDFTKHYDRSH